MALVPVRGVLAVEDRMTGDGRLLAPDSVEWADLPLPLAWLAQGDQHISEATEGPQVGFISSIVRNGASIDFEGAIDDENADGAEVIRRLRSKSAPFGSRFGVSIDGDDFEVEIVAKEGLDETGLAVVASGRLKKPFDAATVSDLVAAAGDGDPGGEVLFEDSADAVYQRFTRLRVRGATLVSVAAFQEAYLELADEAAPAVTAAMPGMPEHDFTDPSGDGFCDFCVTSDDAGDCTMQCGMTVALHSMVNEGMAASSDGGAEAQVAALPASSAPVRPPLAWFREAYPQPGDERLVEQANGGMAVPLTISDDGQVFGMVGGTGCHTGYLDQCVLIPDSPTGYSRYHLGTVECDDGTFVNTGPLVIGSDHPSARLFAEEARDYYANACLAWADVRVADGPFGPWACGALRPGVTPEQVRVLRACNLSGDWRDEGRGLDLIAALAVNGPGFPILRESIAASGLPPIASSTGPRVHIVDGRRTALVAAGVVHRCPECAERERLQAATGWNRDTLVVMREMLERIDRRTKALIPQAVAASAARIRGDG